MTPFSPTQEGRQQRHGPWGALGGAWNVYQSFLLFVESDGGERPPVLWPPLVRPQNAPTSIGNSTALRANEKNAKRLDPPPPPRSPGPALTPRMPQSRNTLQLHAPTLRGRSPGHLQRGRLRGRQAVDNVFYLRQDGLRLFLAEIGRSMAVDAQLTAVGA